MIYPLFSSRIVMVHPAELESRKPKSAALRSDSPWLISGRVSLQPEGYTEGAYNCNIIALHNGEKTTVAHLNPEDPSNNYQAVKNALDSDIDALMKSGKPVQAVITGGRGYADSREANSRQLFNWLKQILDEKQIPYSVVWGAANSYVNAAKTGVYCLPANDLVLISNGAVTESSLATDFVEQQTAPGDTFEVLLGKLDFRAEEARRAATDKPSSSDIEG